MRCPRSGQRTARLPTEAGRVADRKSWRMVGPVHIAETREQARANVRFGLQFWLNYFTKVGTLPLGHSGDGNLETEIDALLNAKIAVIGTPDDLIDANRTVKIQSWNFWLFPRYGALLGRLRCNQKKL